MTCVSCCNAIPKNKSVYRKVVDGEILPEPYCLLCMIRDTYGEYTIKDTDGSYASALGRGACEVPTEVKVFQDEYFEQVKGIKLNARTK